MLLCTLAMNNLQIHESMTIMILFWLEQQLLHPEN